LGSRVFYRIVSTDKPTPDGFLSYKELGIRVSPDTEAMRHLAEGLSVYELREQAEDLSRAKPRLGTFVTRLVVPDDDPSVQFERTGSRDGHYTLWLYPLETQSTRALDFVEEIGQVH
jgi:hypothetical protein